MIADTWLLLTLRWHLGWNNFRSRKPWVKALMVIGITALVATGVTLSAGIGVAAGAVLHRFPQENLDAFLPGLVLTGVAFLILLSSFGIALGSLFLSSDLETLMTAPVDRKAVFTSKILDGLGYYYALIAVLAVPALVMYGIGIGYGPPYYILALIAVLGTPLMPAGLAALLVILVARFAPASRVKEVLGLFGALFGLACGLLGQTSRFWARDVVAPARSSPESFLSSLRGLENLPIPSLVAGRGLMAAGTGDMAGAAVNLAGFLAITFGFFFLVVLVADNLYSTGWVRMQSSGTAGRNKQKAERVARRSGLLGRGPAYLAIMFKDWRVLPRDLRNFAQFLAPLLFLPIIYLNLLGRPGERNPLDAISGAGGGFDATNILIAGGVLFATAMIFGRIADTSISREGKSWWLIKAAPISPAEVIRGKFLSALIPYVILSTVLFVFAWAWRGFSPAGFIYGWYGIQLLGAAMLAIETGLSVPWARLDWDDPRRMSSGWGSLLSLVAWAVLAIISGGLLCLPVLAEIFDPSLEFPAVLAGVALSTALIVASSVLALQFGVSRLATVGEAD